MSSILLAAIAALATESGSQSTPTVEVQPPEAELWAGRMAVMGTRKLPFIGAVEFRNDNFALARVRRTAAGELELDQQICSVHFEKVAGAQASMDPIAIRKAPRAQIRFTLEDDGTLLGSPWKSGWDRVDYDQDGFPGIAVSVDATLCGGTMHFASDATTVARATQWDAGIAGVARIRVSQIVEKVQGACLKLVTRDVTQDLDARFVYRPVPPGTTCDNVPDEAWVDPVELDLGPITAPALPNPSSP